MYRVKFASCLDSWDSRNCKKRSLQTEILQEPISPISNSISDIDSTEDGDIDDSNWDFPQLDSGNNDYLEGAVALSARHCVNKIDDSTFREEVLFVGSSLKVEDFFLTIQM